MPEHTQHQADRRQFVRFAFYKAEPAWRQLPGPEREAGKAQFAAVVDEAADGIMVRPYSTVASRGDVDFMLWEASDRLEALHELAARLSATGLGRYLSMAHSFLAMTRRSIYIQGHSHEGQERTQVRPRGSKYLFVYPFVKTRAWYRLDKAERQRMMEQHFAIGHRYPGVKINTTYSFGLDDKEFVLAFESDDAGAFLDLVMELRESEASQYTLRDTPSFTCLAMPIREALDALG
jgi:chlorite dismutase